MIAVIPACPANETTREREARDGAAEASEELSDSVTSSWPTQLSSRADANAEGDEAVSLEHRAMRGVTEWHVTKQLRRLQDHKDGA